MQVGTEFMHGQFSAENRIKAQDAGEKKRQEKKENSEGKGAPWTRKGKAA